MDAWRKSQEHCSRDEVPLLYTLNSLWSLTESSHMVQIWLILGDVIRSVWGCAWNSWHQLWKMSLLNSQIFHLRPIKQVQQHYWQCGSVYGSVGRFTIYLCTWLKYLNQNWIKMSESFTSAQTFAIPKTTDPTHFTSITCMRLTFEVALEMSLWIFDNSPCPPDNELSDTDDALTFSLVMSLAVHLSFLMNKYLQKWHSHTSELYFVFSANEKIT